MKIKQDSSNQIQFNDRATEINPRSLDLSLFSNHQVNRTLEFNNTLVGQVLIKDDIFYLTLDENAPKITITGFPPQKKLIIESVHDIKIADINNKNLEGLVINANNIDIDSELNISKGLALEAKQNLSISSPLKNLENAHFSCNELRISDQGSIEFRTLQSLPEKAIRSIEAKKLVLQGKIDATRNDACILTLDNLELQGAYTLKNTECNVTNKIHFNGHRPTLVKDVVFEAQSCHFSGENNFENVEFIADDMAFSDNSNSVINASRFDVLNELLLHKQSKNQWVNCNIYTDSAQLQGKADLRHCNLESRICVTSEQTILKSTKIEARLFWQDEGAQIDECDIKAESSSLLNKTNIEKTDLLTNSLIYTSTGTLNACNVTVTNSVTGSDRSNLSFKQCFLKSGQTYTQGILNFSDESYHQTNYIQQTAGTIKIDNSIVENNGLLLSMSNTNLLTDNKAKIKVQSALLNGSSKWNTSKLAATGPVMFCGKTTGEKAAIASKDSIYLMNDTKSFTESTLKSNKDIVALSQLELSENSHISAHDLNISNNFKSNNTSIDLQGTLKTQHNSNVEINASSITAKNMSFMGSLKFARTELKAEANVIFGNNAKVRLNQVKLEATESIVNSVTAEITGSQVDTKSDHFSQEGKVKIDELKVSANTILHSGTTASDKSVQFKANLGMINTGSLSAHELKIQASSLLNAAGQIDSDKSVSIQAPLIINYMGDIHSHGSLSMDSLVHINNMGLEQAYDYTSKSLYNANYGFILPELPNSLSEVFTTTRGISAAKMALTQLIPDYSNLISLGFMAAPYVPSVKDSAKFLYDFYQSSDSLSDLPSKIRNELPTKIYNAKPVKDFRDQFAVNETADVLPVMMNVMSNGLSMLQLGNVLLGVNNELTKKDSSTPPANTTPQDNKAEDPNQKSTSEKACELMADIAMTTLAPSITSQSYWGENAGLMFSANVTDSAFDDTNLGFKAGWNFAGNYNRGVNKGLFAGANLVAKGDSYTNHGRIFNSKKASLIFKDGITNTEGSHLDLTNYQIKTNQFTNAGQLDLTKGEIEATRFLQTSTGKAEIAQTVGKIKEDAVINGEYTLDKTDFTAKNITLNDQGNLNQSTVRAEEKLTQNGQLTAKETVLSGKEVSLKGVQATDGKIISQQGLSIKNANTVGTSIAAKEADLADSTFKAKKPVETDNPQSDDTPVDSAPKKESDANRINIEGNLTTHNVVIEGMQVDSGNHIDNNGTYQNARLSSKNNFTGKDTTFESSTVQANTANLIGQTVANQSSIQATEKLTQNGKMIAKESSLSGKDVSLDGLESTDGNISAQNELSIKNANTVGTQLAAKNANLADSTFKAKKDAEPETNNTQSAETTPETAPKAESNTNKIAIEENLVTTNVIIEGMEITANNHQDTQGSYQNTHIAVKNDFTGTNTKLDTSTVHAKTASLLGETTVNHSSVIAQEKLTQIGHLTGEGASLVGENVSLDGAHLQNSFVIANQQLAIKNSHTLDTGISGKAVDLRDSKFKSSVIPIEEDTETKEQETDTEQQNPEQETPEVENQTPKELGSNQINASESLYTSNVEMDGQMIEAGKVNFSDSLAMKNCSTKASDSIVFAENASVTTHNAGFKATNSIMHQAKDHLQTGYLTLEAKEVRDTAAGTIRSGEGEKNSVYIKAEKGGFKSTMQLDNANFDVKHLDNAEDLIGQRGQSSHQHFANSLKVQTNQTINIEGMKPRDCNVSVIADAVNVNSDYKSEKNVTLTATEGKVKINADLSGNIVELKSEKSNVEVNGKTVTGKSYVHIEAEKDVILEATEKKFRGKHDWEKEYTKAKIIGGAGNEDTGGRGVIIHAKNKVRVTGSDILADGKVRVSGDKGVRIKANSHTYVADKWSKKKKCCGVKHGKKKYERIETKLNTSTIGSSQDQVEIISLEGSVMGEGGNFIAKNGTDIYAEKDIKLKGIKTQTQIRKENSSCFGLNSKKSKDKHEHMKLYDFVDDGGNTRLHANTGNVEGQDLRFIGPGDLEFSAPNGEVLLSASKLNHSHKSSERKFTLSSPTLQAGKQLVSDKKGLAKQMEPTLGHAEAAINSKNPIEQAASGWNAGVNGYNTMNALQEDAYGQQFLQGFMPKVNLNLSETKSSSEWQTGTGAGIFKKGNVSFNAKNKVSLDGVPVEAKNLKVKAKEFEVKGQSFESSHKHKSKSVTVGVTPTGGVTDASASVSSNKMKSKHYQNANISVENEIDVDAQHVVLDAANMDCDTIKMKADKLTIQSRQDEMHSTSQSANASTTGSVGLHQSKTDAKQTNQVAGIHVRSGIAKEDMQVKEANLIGGAVTTDGHNGFEPEKLNTQTLKDYSHTSGFGISGNVNSVANALKDDSKEKPSRLTTFNVSHEERDYKANVQATVYGQKGVSETLANNNPNLNTSSAQAKVVTRDTSHKVSIEVPVEVVRDTVKSGIRFFDKPITTVGWADKPRSETPTTIDPTADTVGVTDSEEPTTNQELPTEDKAGWTDNPRSEEPTTNQELPTEDKVGWTDNPKSEDPTTNQDLSTEDTIGMTDNPKSEDPNLSPNSEEEQNTADVLFPRPRPQTIGLKNGRNGRQVFNVNTGQYTTVEKELETSAENSQFTGRVELVLFEGTYLGLFYKGRLDPVNNKFILEARAGDQYNANITNHSIDLGSAGSGSVALNACSAEGFIRSDIEASPTGASLMVQGGAGVMGPSLSGEYTTPSMSFMGITFQTTVEGTAGVGIKATAGAGVGADSQKMKVRAVGKLGLFKGIGGQGTVKIEFGLDPKFFEEHHKAYVEIFEGDPIAMSILEKKKNFQPVQEWERDYFDDKLDEVTNTAQARAWKGGK